MIPQQEFGEIQLDDSSRQGRWNDATPVAAIPAYEPAVLRGDLPGDLLGIPHPHELRRILEGRVRRIDDRLRHQGDHRPRQTRVGQRLLDPVPDHALGLCHQIAQRIGARQRLVGHALQRQQPDLRTVAMDNYNLMLSSNLSQRRRRRGQMRKLNSRIRPLPTPQQRIPTQRDHHPHNVILARPHPGRSLPSGWHLRFTGGASVRYQVWATSTTMRLVLPGPVIVETWNGRRARTPSPIAVSPSKLPAAATCRKVR
jgi:hypothetical protein